MRNDEKNIDGKKPDYAKVRYIILFFFVFSNIYFLIIFSIDIASIIQNTKIK
jgi:hypothetical protein